MALDCDEEILHDFLTEAGELLDGLNEQLVELEQRPDDTELVNAAFRAFHTIKGGAGFVGLDPLVRICHVAEDCFGLVRTGDLAVDSELMDLFLQALDVVNAQFGAARDGVVPDAAPQALVDALAAVAAGESAGSPPADAPAEPEVVEVPAAESDPADAALEALLGGMMIAAAPAPAPAAAVEAVSAAAEATADAKSVVSSVLDASGDITDDEFEALLDALQGKGESAPAPAIDEAPAAVVESAPVAVERAPAPKPAGPRGPADPKPPRSGGSSGSSGGDDTVRVDVQRLDEIMNLVGELVLARNRLMSFQQDTRDVELARISSNVDRVTADMQAAVMASRLQPVKRVFSRFPRLVRDLARDLGKKVELRMEGTETELDKNLVDALAEPLVHLVRNAVDHGIEMPAVREAAGKDPEGTVTLAARHGGDHVLVTVTENGAGMDPEKLRERAVERGVITAEQAARMKDGEARQLVFEPGFSTREVISDTSGRGVGMDVVKTRIAQLNGSVEIESEIGSGTTFAIRLPLTLAILPTLMVTIADQRFALPLSSVIETYEYDAKSLQVIDGRAVLLVREAILPLYRSRDLLGLERSDGRQHVVALMVENRRVGVVVDDLLGKEEVVIKPLGAFVRQLPGLSGATITGDGRIALILDVADLVRRTEASLPVEMLPCSTS